MIEMSDVLSFLSWYITIFVVGLVSLPITFRLFPNLTSKGYALARPLGLLVWGYFFWLLCSLGVLQNDTGGVVFALLLLVGLSIWCSMNGRWQKLTTWVKQNKKTLITMEVLFFIAFGLWTIVRAANPDVVYTEKPMELAFINAILKSPSFPPNDPWLSGYAISYYYFGYVMVSMLIRVSGVTSAIGFNLSAALWFALTALATYGIVFDMLSTWKLRIHSDGFDRYKLARNGAFLGPFFVLIVSCLEGLLEFLYSWQVFWKINSEGILTSRFWTWLSVSELELPPTTPVSFFPNRPANWLWWRGTRVIQDLTLTNQKIEVIAEFPFATYLLSDLHPHLLGMPFVLLAVGICLNLFLNPEDNIFFTGSIKNLIKRWDYWFIALTLGSLAFINTWDFPIYVGLFCLTGTYLRIRKFGWNLTRGWEFVKTGVVIGLTGIFLFLPFYLGFSSQAGGILPSMEYITRGIHFWILFGALLIPIGIWLIYQLIRSRNLREFLGGLRFAFILFGVLLLASLLFGVLILETGQISSQLVSSGKEWLIPIGLKLSGAYQAFTSLHGSTDSGLIVTQSLLRRLLSPGTWITLLLILAAVWSLLINKKDKSTQLQISNQNIEVMEITGTLSIKIFVFLLMLVGVALTAVPEFFYLRDNFGWRMNTIFKFYFQAWVLWGIVAAYASVELFTRLKGFMKWLFNGIWIIIILAGLAYPVVMLWDKTNGFKPPEWTLDGNAYMARYYQDDYAAIQWLDKQPLGIIAEAVGPSYSFDNHARVSTRTGMPTVLNWPGHEGQWRGSYKEVGSREAEIKTLYTSNDWTEVEGLINKYDIRYIYFGDLEKNFYKTDGELLRSNLPVIYQNSSVTIFEAAAQKSEGLP